MVRGAIAIVALLLVSSAPAGAKAPSATPSSLPAMPSSEEAAALAAQGARPGDEQLTCQQIGAEMQPYAASLTPSAQVMGADAQAMQAYAAKRQSEAMAQAPVNMVGAIAASLLPGGGAIAQAQAAAQYAQAKRDEAAAKPMTDKYNADTTAFAGQAAPMMQDPRLQRLMQLSQQKCQNMR